MKTFKKCMAVLFFMIIIMIICPAAVYASAPETEGADQKEIEAEELDDWINPEPQMTGDGKIVVGDGVTATFDADTGAVVFYSEGGTLWRDWIAQAGLAKDEIKSIDSAVGSGVIYLPEDSHQMFFRCTNLVEANFYNFDASKAVNMNGMFYWCESLERLNLTPFITDKATNMGGMFMNCKSLKSLNVVNFNVSGVENIASFLFGCENLRLFRPPYYNELEIELPVTLYDRDGTAYESAPENAENLILAKSDLWDKGYIVGDMVKASYDPETCDVVLYSDEGTLWKDWKSIITETYYSGGIRTVRAAESSGTVYFPADSNGMFYFMSGLKEVDLAKFDTSKVRNAESMFDYCKGLANIDVSKFDTSGITNMKNMFFECESFTELDLSGFDTSNVTDMSAMFNYCTGLNELDVSGFDTSNVTDMSLMFNSCRILTGLDVSGFDTSNVEKMCCMFDDCQKLQKIDVSGFDTSKVTDMGGLFTGCTSLAEPDLSGFDTSNVTDMGYMFANTGFKKLDLSNFDTSNVESMECMFTGSDKLEKLDIGTFDMSKVERAQYMFDFCTALKILRLPFCYTDFPYRKMPVTLYDVSGNEYPADSEVPNQIVLATADEWEKGYIAGLDVKASFDPSTGTLEYFSDGGTLFGRGPTGVLVDSQIKSIRAAKTSGKIYLPPDCDNLFALHKGLTDVDLRKFDSSKVTNMDYMFVYCWNLENINLTDFDTSNVKTMEGMFWNSGIRNLDLSSFDVSNVENMKSMLMYMGNLQILKTPKNNSLDVQLYKTMYDAAGNAYDALPKQAESIRLAITPKLAYEFTDVADMSAWYYDAVYWAYVNDVTSGMGEGTFQPMANLSRAQTVMFLYKLAGQPDVSGLPDPGFKDVTSDKWYYNAVKWAVAKGITSGYGSGTFQPDVTCNRAMIVTFLMRYSKLAGTYVAPTSSSSFSDVPADAWYKDAVDWAVSSGVTTGYGEGTFQPMRTCNRAMMVTFLKRVAELPEIVNS